VGSERAVTSTPPAPSSANCELQRSLADPSKPLPSSMRPVRRIGREASARQERRAKNRSSVAGLSPAFSASCLLHPLPGRQLVQTATRHRRTDLQHARSITLRRLPARHTLNPRLRPLGRVQPQCLADTRLPPRPNPDPLRPPTPRIGNSFWLGLPGLAVVLAGLWQPAGCAATGLRPRAARFDSHSTALQQTEFPADIKRTAQK